MTLVDKLLLGLLIVLLPLGLVLSRTLLTPKEGANESDGTKKIETLLERIAQQKPATAETAEKFQITAVFHASESATFKIAGIAPSGKYSIRASQVLLPAAGGVPTELDAKKLKADEVLGQQVLWRAIKPQADGGFVYEAKITETTGVLEVQLDQAGVTTVIRYDLGQRKQLD